LRTGSGAVFTDVLPGRVSVGIAYEASRDRLWVAGGGPGFNLGVGDVRVYDASSGALLATFLPPGDVGALNDVAITHDAVYVTDSFNAQLVVIPLPADGSLPSVDSATLLPVSGIAQTGGPNLKRNCRKEWRAPRGGDQQQGSSSASTPAVGSQRPVHHTADSRHRILDHPTAAPARKRLSLARCQQSNKPL
jgi:hypothetical protein